MNWTREARYTALNADSRERYEALCAQAAARRCLQFV